MRLSPERLVSPEPPRETFTSNAVEVGGFRLVRRGRFWQVFDPQDRLIVTAVYKKGGIEVIRRLLPLELRPLAEEAWKRTALRPKLTRTAYNPRRTATG